MYLRGINPSKIVDVAGSWFTFRVNTIDVALAQVAARQRSLVHRDQALALGMTVRQFQARTKSGLYLREQPNVFRLAGVPVTWEQRVLAACMAAGTGAVASHRCAALLWGLRGIEQAPVEVTVPLDRRPRLTDVVVHRMAVADHATRWGIPVTSATSTLAVLGAFVDAATLESAVEHAIFRRLTSPQRLLEYLEKLGPRGVNGSAALRRVLEERGPGAAATESVLEDEVARLLRAAGIYDFERQYWVEGYRLDFAAPPIKLGLEVNGVAFHSAAIDVQRNCHKLNRLVALGWRVLQFTAADIRRRPRRVVGELSSAMAA